VQRLRELNNFNTLMAVVGGLTHSCLARLIKTNSHIPHETQKVSSFSHLHCHASYSSQHFISVFLTKFYLIALTVCVM